MRTGRQAVPRLALAIKAVLKVLRDGSRKGLAGWEGDLRRLEGARAMLCLVGVAKRSCWGAIRTTDVALYRLRPRRRGKRVQHALGESSALHARDRVLQPHLFLIASYQLT